MLELDILVGEWSKKNIPNFSIDDCQLYEKEVLSLETSDLFFRLIELKKTDEYEMNYYLKRIKMEGRSFS